MIDHSRWFFRGFSKSLGRFLSPEELALAGVWLHSDGKLHHHPDVELVHYTGKMDQNRTPLFEKDVVEFDQITEFGLVKRRGFLKWFVDPGHYSIAMDGDVSMQGVQFSTQNVKRIGSLLESRELMKQDPTYGKETKD